MRKKLVLVITIPWRSFITTYNKLRKSLKGLQNSCKIQIVFKRQRKFSNVFCFKDHLPFDLVSEVLYKYICRRYNSAYYDEIDRHLKVIGMSFLTFKITKPSKESAIRDHLLNCNDIPSFELHILANRNEIEIKESLLIKRDRPSLKKIVLLNCSFLTIVRFLIVSLYSNIV